MALRPRTPGARALLPATRHRASGQLGALLSSPVLGVRLMTALQVLQVLKTKNSKAYLCLVFTSLRDAVRTRPCMYTVRKEMAEDPEKREISDRRTYGHMHQSAHE